MPDRTHPDRAAPTSSRTRPIATSGIRRNLFTTSIARRPPSSAASSVSGGGGGGGGHSRHGSRGGSVSGSVHSTTPVNDENVRPPLSARDSTTSSSSGAGGLAHMPVSASGAPDRVAHYATSSSTQYANVLDVTPPEEIVVRDKNGIVQIPEIFIDKEDEDDFALQENLDRDREKLRLRDAVKHHQMMVKSIGTAQPDDELMAEVKASLRSHVAALDDDDWMFAPSKQMLP